MAEESAHQNLFPRPNPALVHQGMVSSKVAVELPGVTNPGKLVNDQADGGVLTGADPFLTGLPASFDQRLRDGRGIDGHSAS